MDQATGFRWVGIDVSKATLDVAILPDHATFRVSNDAPGWQQLVDRVELPTIAGIVLEATGRDHLGVTLALAAAGVAPAVINPQRTHAFIASEGMLNKTDRTDARMLARFGQRKPPPPSPVATETARHLKELVACRDACTKTLVMAKNRLSVASAHVRDFHQATITFLTAHLARVDQQLVTLIRQDGDVRERARQLQSGPGLGRVLSPVLLARLAELGRRDPKTLAALAGVAPYSQDSGAKHGPQAIRGGRPEVCKALFQMARTAVRRNPVMKTHDQQLQARGKPDRVAVIAGARRMLGIINAMLRDGLTWPQTRVGQGHFLPQPA